MRLGSLDCRPPQDTIADPYPHLAHAEMFPEALALDLLDWLESSADWVRRPYDEFSTCSAFSLHTVNLPGVARRLVDEAFLVDLGTMLSALFGVRVGNGFRVGAQKLEPGDEMLVHSDDGPHAQAIRAVVHLNRGWSPSQGGVFFVLDDDNEPTDRSRRYLPVHNSLYAFVISARSFHAVSRVQSGTRYSLCFSFARSMATDSVPGRERP